MGESLISGLGGKASLGASLWAVTKLWPRKVVFRGQIYSARAKLMLISDQSRDLVEIVLKAGIYVSFFKTARLHVGSCQESVHVMIYVERVRVIE